MYNDNTIYNTRSVHGCVPCSLFFCLYVCVLYVSKSKVHCVSAVRFGKALQGFLITAHHLCAFLLYLAR